MNFIFNRTKELIKSLLYIPTSKIVISWFNDYHTLIPIIISKIFFKKSVIIVGGYDAIVDAENNHGVFFKQNIRSKIARLNYSLVSEIWVVHKSLIKGCDEASRKFNITSGVENFIQNKSLKIKEILTGYDSRYWNYDESIEELEKWINDGGTLVKFAGENFIKDIESLSHKKLRSAFSLTGKKISIGGKLSLKQSLNLLEVSDESPLHGLEIPNEIEITKYIESSPSSSYRNINVWLRLENGTPLISSISQSKGQIILFHIKRFKIAYWNEFSFYNIYIYIYIFFFNI